MKLMCAAALDPRAIARGYNERLINPLCALAAFSQGRALAQNQNRPMAQGSKAKYTSKQKRKAEHIEEGYEDRGTPKKGAGRRAWATVNKEDQGGKKSGSGRGKKISKTSSRKGGKKGGAKKKSTSRSEK